MQKCDGRTRVRLVGAASPREEKRREEKTRQGRLHHQEVKSAIEKWCSELYQVPPDATKLRVSAILLQINAFNQFVG
ncbi:hypothetical protein [Nostoc sp. ATCC 53789]|uniref:hypothetical protein n=1 Tax=Nostoc sp. ATCC 53789 TaxID=76335 RepID=UPI000DECB5F0|nr:hypothetical protein [Nostoc sp. ATCC 53789]QHG20213.1 hypothetical protein GJB62_30115 [Nostoc sp. ATCC 53789]RCJ28691.1 hypothetical protein A6V25_16230 [Nostoc sp. ATCC 53789]